MKKLLLAIAVLSFISLSAALGAPLTPDQKQKDFEYLCKVIEENYPFAGMLERKTGADWRSEKDAYLERLMATPDDSSYIVTLSKIVAKFKDGHFDLSPTFMHSFFLEAYAKVSEATNGKMRQWVDALENGQDKAKYWQGLLHVNPNNKTTGGADEKSPSPNRYTILVEQKTGILHLRSLMHELIEQDSVMLERFWRELDGCEHLVIDIQQNGGGSTSYWSEHIVPRLIRDTITYPSYSIIKNGDVNRSFYPDYTDKEPLLPRADMPGIPPELLDGTYSLTVEYDTIAPRNPIDFTGSIHLLVDGRVFSSAEGFAQFCKTTGWAVVIGQGTRGGHGSDPVIFALPESGILLRYSALTSLNSEGSLNAEKGIIPDIPLQEATPEARLVRLIKLIATD